jgi:signal transduction histidine kinase
VAAGQLAVVLIVLALASIPVARSVTAPIARLTKITRAFGAGDYRARASSARQDELGALASAFDEMADRIAELRRSEKELIANVSHELRTPLARIRLALELLSDGDRAKASSYMVDIGEDLAELERLLDDVMTTARLDLAADATSDGLPPLRLETLDARALLEASAARFAKRYPERVLNRHFEKDLPLLEADPPILRRAIDNLLDNAVKFSDTHQPIEISALYTASDARCVIEVADRGVGIPEEDIPRVFTPFFRSDPSRARTTGGVGLGLTLARRVVESHGGSIGIESRVGSGTRFRISLPALVQKT